ncbi:hypothetical protein SHAM105786_03985 [Shewanella amazonensis]|uniref:DUF1579 domain-containing protein n=1 Tax=Shewanella amazonensis (strain ATCC BAA-1098 / SB2B) TaxID=326297 RepID=A1S4J9_SHEAM|nr:hypothetical protein [Shewanella amazonensis]ABL99305.1 hypothetical protein Sama_1098 [Shewanella amazonensis SB2B]
MKQISRTGYLKWGAGMAALSLLVTISTMASAQPATATELTAAPSETALSTEASNVAAPQQGAQPQQGTEPQQGVELQQREEPQQGTQLAESQQPDSMSDTARGAEISGADFKAIDATDAQALIGSWELVSGRYLDGEGRWVSYNTLGLVAIKVISNGHFSFTTMKTVKNKPEFWAAGAGEYRIDGASYTEYPTLNSFQVPQGQGFSFDYELIGNQWHTKRFEDGLLKEEEVWQRLD